MPKTTSRNWISVGAGTQESAFLKSSPGDSEKINLMPLLPETQRTSYQPAKGQ